MFPFLLGFSALYFTQYLLKSRLPYQRKYFLVLPSVASCGVAWVITSKRAKVCQDCWTTAEYTDFELKNSTES